MAQHASELAKGQKVLANERLQAAQDAAHKAAVANSWPNAVVWSEPCPLVEVRAAQPAQFHGRIQYHWPVPERNKDSRP
jgi:hypothetical protein